ALVLGGDEVAQQVLTWGASTLFDDLDQVRAHGVQASLRRLGDLERQLARGDEWDEVVGPALEPIALRGRDAEELGDDDRRRRIRHLADQVHRAAFDDRDDQLVDDGLDAWLSGFGDTPRERGRDQFAQSGVVGRVRETN